MNDYQSVDSFELLAILLVSHGSSGSHLLFKYPFTDNIKINNQQSGVKTSNKKSPYSFVSSDNTNWIIEKEQNLVNKGLLCGLDNDVLAALCIMNKDKLELKIDNVFFLSSQTILKINPTIYNVVLAVRSPLPRPVIKCYQALSLAIARALMKEESNSGYLSFQSKILNDYICEHQNLSDNKIVDLGFAEAFEKSALAREFKSIYESIKKDGTANLLINNCTKLSFCLPHLAYKITEKNEQTKFVEVIFDAINYLKPYFGFLLLKPRESLLNSMPNSCNFYTHRLIELYNPRFCLARYAAELDVSLNEVYSIVDHLIYWAKVKIIYPITETNVYIINPNASIYIGSKLNEDFNETFETYSFQLVLSQFSAAKPLVEHLNPKQPKEKHSIFIDMLMWLLQQNAIIQIHSFLYLLPRKTEHSRLACERYSKLSDLSIGNLNAYFMTSWSRIRINSLGYYDFIMIKPNFINGPETNCLKTNNLFNCKKQIDEDNDLSLIENKVGVSNTGVGSEHSNDTENTDQKDLSAVYDEYRVVFNEYNVNEKDQHYIFKSFENRNEQDIKLFMQLMPYYNGLTNMEEIIYNEQLTRSEIVTFLDKFKDLLIASCYEDPNPLIRINAKIN